VIVSRNLNRDQFAKSKIQMAKKKVPRLKRDFRFASTSYFKARCILMNEAYIAVR